MDKRNTVSLDHLRALGFEPEAGNDVEEEVLDKIEREERRLGFGRIFGQLTAVQQSEILHLMNGCTVPEAAARAGRTRQHVYLTMRMASSMAASR